LHAGSAGSAGFAGVPEVIERQTMLIRAIRARDLTVLENIASRSAAVPNWYSGSENPVVSGAAASPSAAYGPAASKATATIRAEKALTWFAGRGGDDCRASPWSGTDRPEPLPCQAS